MLDTIPGEKMIPLLEQEGPVVRSTDGSACKRKRQFGKAETQKQSKKGDFNHQEWKTQKYCGKGRLVPVARNRIPGKRGLNAAKRGPIGKLLGKDGPAGSSEARAQVDRADVRQAIRAGNGE